MKIIGLQLIISGAPPSIKVAFQPHPRVRLFLCKMLADSTKMCYTYDNLNNGLGDPVPCVDHTTGEASKYNISKSKLADD